MFKRKIQATVNSVVANDNSVVTAMSMVGFPAVQKPHYWRWRVVWIKDWI